MPPNPPSDPGSASAQSGGRHTAPELDHEGGHGHSIAAWTAVGVVITGFLIGAIAMIMAQVWLFVIGAVLIAVGGILGKVLSAMGFGQPGRDRTPGAEGVR